MAYNSFYQPFQPINYGQYPTYQTGAQMAQQGYQQAQNAQQIQNSGFVSVPSETVARNYPVAPGNSVTFIDEVLEIMDDLMTTLQVINPRLYDSVMRKL